MLAGTWKVLLGVREVEVLSLAGLLFHGAPRPGGAIRANLEVVRMIAEKAIIREERTQGGRREPNRKAKSPPSLIMSFYIFTEACNPVPPAACQPLKTRQLIELISNLLQHLWIMNKEHKHLPSDLLSHSVSPYVALVPFTPFWP